MAHKKLTLAISMLSSMSAFSNVLVANDNSEASPCRNIMPGGCLGTCPRNDQNLSELFNADSCPFYNTLSAEEKASFDQLVKNGKSLIAELSQTDFSNIADKYIDILKKYAAFKNVSVSNFSLTFTHKILESSPAEPKQVTQESDLSLKEFFATLTPEEVAQLEALLNELDGLCKKVTDKLDGLFATSDFSVISTAIKNNNKILQVLFKFEQTPSLVFYSYQRIIS